MLTLVSRHSLRTYNAQLPALLNLNNYQLTKHIHRIQSNPSFKILKHSFSWSSDSNKRITAPKQIQQPLPDLKGAEAEYPGEWTETGDSKKPIKPIETETETETHEQSYLEDEHFLGKQSPIQQIHGLIKPKLPDLDKKEALTPLAEEIKQIIHARGPMTFSSFWQMCMQHPKYGYYMTSDPIGREGDFITTPEMFSGFGECLAIWCAFTWESMGRPHQIKIIEYGPGLGTVAKTMIDVLRKAPLKPFKDAVSIHLIESSPRLRWKQKTKLGLANIRKFKIKVEKPVYAVTDISPYATRDGTKGRENPLMGANNINHSSNKKIISQSNIKSSEEIEYHKNPENKATKLMGLHDAPIQSPKQSKGVTPLNTDPEIRIDPKKKIRPIISQQQNMNSSGNSDGEDIAFKTRDDIPPELLEPVAKKKEDIKKKKVSNILGPGEDLEGKMKSNPFKTDTMFGEMSQKAMSAMGLGGNMELTEDIKQKYKPFDWSQHDPGIFGHVDDEMKPYITGEKSREWEQSHSKIEVRQDPLTAKSDKKSKTDIDDNNDIKTESKLQGKIEDTSINFSAGVTDRKKKEILDSTTHSEDIKVYDENLSEYGAATTLPPRKTKRDIESEIAKKENIGFDEDAYRELEAPESPANPFQPILDKIEIQELKGGSGAGIDFTDLLDYDTLRGETTFEEEEIWQTRTKDNILISWHDSLHSIDGGSPALFICHEFFDALPISHFEFRPHGWVETVVDVDDDDNNTQHFKLIRGPVATFASTVLDRQFQAKGIKPSIGQQFSICSQGNEIMNHISKWIKQYGGAGFIIDYGNDNIPAWTVQGIKEHKPANILSKPGEIDISSHVNFNALKSAIQSQTGVKAFGPVTQSYFLQGCGIVERFRQYIKDKYDSDPNKDDEENKKQKKEFFDTFAKIMDVDKLGAHFKVLGFGRANYGVPIGFRSPISEQQAKTDEMGLPLYK
eukprot:11283_1